MFFNGYAAWPLDKLQQEADAGRWTVVQAPATRLLALARRKLGRVGFVDEVLGRRAA